MMQIKLVLENCESIYFDVERDVLFFETSTTKMSYTMSGKSIRKQYEIDGFTIAFPINAGETISHDDDKPTPAERLRHWTDVTQIVLVDDDDSEVVLFVSWAGVKDPSYLHDRQGLIITPGDNAVFYCEGGDYISQLKMCPDMADVYAWK